MPRGGKRAGAGRPKGTGKYSESTKAIRVPISMVERVLEYARSGGFKLPLYGGKVAAGCPAPTDDYIEEQLDLGEQLIKDPDATFLVRVTGYSMINAGIHPDDILIVDRSMEAQHGKIVIAAIDGELTVKRLEKKKGKVRLLPENDEFQPIDIAPEETLHLWGVVTNVIHPV
jgi:DNA polymerase V